MHRDDIYVDIDATRFILGKLFIEYNDIGEDCLRGVVLSIKIRLWIR